MEACLQLGGLFGYVPFLFTFGACCERESTLLFKQLLFMPAVLWAGASPPILSAHSCYWDGGGVGTIEHVWPQG